MFKLLSGFGNKTKEAILEIYNRKIVDVSAANFVWKSGQQDIPFKLVCNGDDVKLNVVLEGEVDGGSAEDNAELYDYYPFPKGEGSNARVVKIYTDAGNTIGSVKIWAVR